VTTEIKVPSLAQTCPKCSHEGHWSRVCPWCGYREKTPEESGKYRTSMRVRLRTGEYGHIVREAKRAMVKDEETGKKIPSLWNDENQDYFAQKERIFWIRIDGAEHLKCVGVSGFEVVR
jgi:hypothetical protein